MQAGQSVLNSHERENHMSNSIEELAKRVTRLEREMQRTGYVIDGIQENTDTRLQAIDAHLDRQDKRFEEIDARFDKFEASVNEQFKHVYGMLADIQANNAEIRNILAVLVSKLG